ncbi:MAG: RNA polymerase sigma factor [Verrucomicrobiales bacterium]
MDEDESHPPAGQPSRGRFPLTRWTLVCQAQDATEVSAHRALSELCELYWYPLYAFVRRSGCDPEDAEDVTQGFFDELLAKDYLCDVAADKGRLRSFLMVSIKHYLSKWRRHARAEKRGGGKAIISIDRELAEERYHLEPADALTPEILYDRHWAMALMKLAHNRLRQEYAGRGKLELFEALGGSLSPNKPEHPHAEIAAQLGMSEGNVRQNASRMRKRYRDILMEEIAQTVHSEEEIDTELAHLFAAFSQ